MSYDIRSNSELNWKQRLISKVLFKGNAADRCQLNSVAGDDVRCARNEPPSAATSI